MNKIKILLVVFILNMGVTSMAASDSLQKVSLQSFEMIRLHNLWLNSSNPAALSLMDELLPGILNANYLFENGEYKRVQQGDKLNQFNFNTLSYSKTKNFNVFGSFNYKRGVEKGLDFSNVNNPFRMSPYHLIDTVGNDNYDREFFSVASGVSVPLNDKLTFGVSMDFNIGLAVQNRDPRPENKVFNMTVSPGFIYSMGNFKLGLNMLYQYYNEEIEIKIIQENTDAVFFSTHGLGLVISHESENFNRIQKRNTGGFAAQLEYSKSNFKTLFGSKFMMYKETNGDGRKASNASWTSIKEDSELNGVQFEVYNYSSITNANSIQQFGIALNINTMIGSEIIQNLEQQPGEDLDMWVKYAVEEKYDATDIKMNAFYEYHKLSSLKKRIYSFRFFGEYHGFSENYYLPMQNEKIDNLKFGVTFDKSFYLKKDAILTLGFGYKYKFNINGELNLSDYTFVAKKILAPDYEFLTSNYFAPKFELAFEIPMKKIFDQYFIKSSVEFYQEENSPISRTIFNISTGVTF